MSVQVEGGTEPYSYEWHERSTALDAEMDEEKIAGITGATEEILKDIVDGYQWAMENWCAAWTYLYERIHGEIPEYEGEVISAGDQKLWDLLGVNDHIYEGTYFDKPTFIGSGGHTYYCVVTDAVGQKAVSQLAEVRNAVSIRTEYGNLNKNMFSGNNSLFCNDIDGTDPRTYQWYMDDGSEGGVPLEGMTASMLTVPSSGRYFCIVTDTYADTARTNTYNMYTAEPFRIYAASGDSTIGEGESAELKLWVTGGTLPYTCEVFYIDDDGYQDSLGSLEGAPVQDEANAGTYCYQLPTDKTGTYWFYLEDAMGETLEVPLTVSYRQLKIKTQPEGGILPLDSGFDLSVEMEEGTEPFTYELYWMGLGWENDGFVNGDFVNESDQNTMTVTDEGTYYFIIRDAEGRWARSDFARVEPYELKLAVSHVSDELTSDNSHIIFVAKAIGGEEPYTYEWARYDQKAGGYVTLNGVEDPLARVTWEGTYLEIKKPGLYRCMVTDVNGAEAGWMAEIPYTGTKPKIVQEPQDIMIPYSTALPATDLVCEAVSGSGDDSNIRYAWEKKTGTGWEPFGSGDTLPLVEDETLEGQISGCYRCIVTDQATGESSTSQEAIVSVELVCQWSGQTDGSTVYFEFEGGKAPYSMHYSLYTYEPQKNGGNPYRLSYKFGHETVLDPRDLTFIFEDVNKYTKIKADKDYFFKVELTDANGQECEEEIPYVWYK